MTAETAPMNLPSGEPDVDLDQYKVPEQGTPRREGFADRVRSRRQAPPKPTKTTVKEPVSKPGEFVDDLEQLYTMIGMGVVMVDKGDHVGDDCSTIIITNAHDIAVKWDELAQKNPNVRRTLRKLLQGGAWAGVIGAHIPIALAIMSNHMPGNGLMPTPKPDDQEAPQEKPWKPVKARPIYDGKDNHANNVRRSAN